MAVEQDTFIGSDEWYALFVKTGAEDKILDKVNKKRSLNMRFHVPRREIRIRRQGSWLIEITPMFPGYILANGQLTDECYSQVKQISDVYSWISDHNGPLTICQNELTLVRKLIDNDDIIRMSKVYYEGDKIVVIDGPLLGNEAIIKKIDRRKGRVKIAVPMFGDEKLIDISVESIDDNRI